MTYILDDLTLAQAVSLRDSIYEEIWRRYEAGVSRGNLLDRYNELETLIFIRKETI